VVPLVLGLAVVTRGDPAGRPPNPAAPAGQPGSRDIGSIAKAIREPSFVGPFGLQEVAMLAAFIVVSLTVPFLTRDLPAALRIVVLSGVGALVGTEAYVRAMTTRSRRAFEAFSWLGEWELARAKRVVGPLPLSPDQAVAWLDAHPRGPIAMAEELPIRIEIELLAGRWAEAAALVEKLPNETPWERFEVAALRDLVDWRAGGDGDLPAMEAAARAIPPLDADDRLRAEVTVAVAKVRRNMADGRAAPGDAAGPLVEVRDRLGARADGQVGRALRRRLIPGLFVILAILTTVGELLGAPI
jgi:hypothetical protein